LKATLDGSARLLRLKSSIGLGLNLRKLRLKSESATVTEEGGGTGSHDIMIPEALPALLSRFGAILHRDREESHGPAAAVSD
jgi:hypothetical protein